MTLPIAVVASIVLIACSPGNADDREARDLQRIEKLIAALASRNPVPQEGGPKGALIYPHGYDLEVEKIPYQVARQLTEFGPKAFPLLMRHSQDKTFSCVRESPSGAMRIISVGTVCERIVAVQLNVFDSVGVYPGNVPNYFDAEVRGDKFTTWWSEHPDHTLREMQIEAFEWALAEQKQLIQKWKPRADAKEDTIHGESYNELLAKMKKSRKENKSQLKELQKADEPLAFDVPIRKHHP